MKNMVLMLFLIGLSSAADQPQSGKDVQVPASSNKLLRPILQKAKELYSDPECQGADYEGRCQEIFTEYQNRVFHLFRITTPKADEALAVLFTFASAHGYSRMPHSTEALTCAVAERGERMLPYLRKYRGCNPDIGNNYPSTMRRLDCREEIAYAERIIKSHDVGSYCR